MTSWYTSMNMEQPSQKPAAKRKSAGKSKPKKVKPVVVVTPTSAENARQKQLAKKKKI